MLDIRTVDPAQAVPYGGKRKALDFVTRYAAMRKSGGRCPYCGVELEFEHGDGERVAFDHIIPLSRGGADDISNLIACCFKCNEEKFTKTAFEFVCELEGIEPPSFASLNPEWDGFSAPYDDVDRSAWLACWPEVYDMDSDDYSVDELYEQQWEEEQDDLERAIQDDLAMLEVAA